MIEATLFALGLLLGASGCVYALYRLIDMVITGLYTQNLWLLVGGGILISFFGWLLIIGFIACSVLLVLLIFD